MEHSTIIKVLNSAKGNCLTLLRIRIPVQSFNHPDCRTPIRSLINSRSKAKDKVYGKEPNREFFGKHFKGGFYSISLQQEGDDTLYFTYIIGLIGEGYLTQEQHASICSRVFSLSKEETKVFVPKAFLINIENIPSIVDTVKSYTYNNANPRSEAYKQYKLLITPSLPYLKPERFIPFGKKIQGVRGQGNFTAPKEAKKPKQQVVSTARTVASESGVVFKKIRGKKYQIGIDGTVISNVGTEKSLKPHDNGTALYVSISGALTKVADLVAEYFLPNPLKLTKVDYKDGNYRNVAASNLKWVSKRTYNKRKPNKVNLSDSRTKRQLDKWKGNKEVIEYLQSGL